MGAEVGPVTTDQRLHGMRPQTIGVAIGVTDVPITTIYGIAPVMAILAIGSLNARSFVMTATLTITGITVETVDTTGKEIIDAILLKTGS